MENKFRWHITKGIFKGKRWWIWKVVKLIEPCKQCIINGNDGWFALIKNKIDRHILLSNTIEMEK